MFKVRVDYSADNNNQGTVFYFEDMFASGYFDETVWAVDNDAPFHVNDRLIENIKPYLRPMSSMTNEENEEFKSIAGGKMIEGYNFIVRKCTLEYKTIAEIEEWLNTNNFDFRGLIEKDLALEAPEGMYKIN